MNESSTDLSTWVKDFKPGDNILQYFRLYSKEIRKTRSGQDYLDVVLSDATGSISGKVWSDVMRKWGHDFTAGDYVKVEGRVENYKDKNQIVVEKIRKVDTSEIPDADALIKKSKQDPKTLMEELRQIAGTLQPPEMSQLVLELLTRHAEDFMQLPAAQMVHHAYQGGLIEHVAAVTRKAMAILPLEEKINANIAIAGAIRHDIGKVRELKPEGAGRSSEGRLIGHVILGLNLLREAAAEVGVLDKPWLTELEHIIISHHGETQFGAPVKPFTREAVLVHFVDNLDAKLKIMAEALESVEADGFAPYNKWLEGKAFVGSACLPQEENDVGS
ncbi:MAG: HD domain-containing protein [Desulfomonile tiedjei]|uniref:HD domain-containing protein n=1 Tax=Desulfomonile tiedjei TaxID=2358 RepID=A0A9D6V141_9BACT|nr:HD domain-containing protein [Desulfomonile tiedjei]